MTTTTETSGNLGGSIEWRGRVFVHRVLIHYDIRATDEAVRRRVDRFLYGFHVARAVAGARTTYEYQGLLQRTAGLHCGQSVIVMTPVSANEVRSLFGELSVPYEEIDILFPADGSNTADPAPEGLARRSVDRPTLDRFDRRPEEGLPAK